MGKYTHNYILYTANNSVKWSISGWRTGRRNTKEGFMSVKISWSTLDKVPMRLILVRGSNVSFTFHLYILSIDNIFSRAYLRFYNKLRIGIRRLWFSSNVLKKVTENPPGTSKVFVLQVDHVNDVVSTGPSIYRMFKETVGPHISNKFSFVSVALRKKAFIDDWLFTAKRNLNTNT